MTAKSLLSPNEPSLTLGSFAPSTPLPSPPRVRFRGGHLPLKTPFFGVRCLGTALECGDKSPHSKRKPTKKERFGDKILNFAIGFVLLVLLIDGGQAVLCALGLLNGGNRGFSNPCPPLNRVRGGERGERWREGHLQRSGSVAVAEVGRDLTGCSFQLPLRKHKKPQAV